MRRVSAQPTTYGVDEPPNVAPPQRPLVDEMTLGTPADLPYPPALASFPVEDPLTLVRTVTADNPVVIDGDPQGLVDATAAEVVGLDGTVLYGPTLLDDPDLFETTIAGDYELVLTDTHRRQAQRWGSIREVMGYTEVAGTEALDLDLSDNRLPVFGPVDDIPDTWRTVAEHRGVVAVTASDYGSHVTYTAEDRPVHALDGDPTTAWSVGAFGEPVGERLRVDLLEPVTTGEITLLQSQRPGANRFITEVELRFDGSAPVTVALDDTSRVGTGQIIRFDPRTFGRLEITISATNVAPRPTYFGVSAVGVAELGLAGITVEEVIHLPTELVNRFGSRLADHPLSIVLTRWRADAREPVRTDPELSIVRGATLPADLTLGVGGDARLSGGAGESVVDQLVGRVIASDGSSLVAQSTSALQGDLHSVASSAFDGDPSTAWRSGFNVGPGTAVEAVRSAPSLVSSVRVEYATGATASVPRRLTILVDGGEVGSTDLPTPDPAGPDVATTTITFAAVPASSLRVVIDEIEAHTTTDWYSGLPSAFPVTIHEVVADGFTFAPVADDLDTGCREDLLTIDGTPLPIRITGRTADALARRPLAIEGCTPAALTSGDHLIRAAQGRLTGVDLDQLVLSAPGRANVTEPAPGRANVTEPAPGRANVTVLDNGRTNVTVLDNGRTEMVIEVPRPTEPTWLVLAQSHNAGWEAHLDGGSDLGEPTLVEGYANGWLLDPADIDPGAVDERGMLHIGLRWAPQQTVRRALVVSLLGLAGCLVLALRGRRSMAPLASPITLATDRAVSLPRRPVALAAVVVIMLFALLNLPDAPAWALVVGLSLSVPLWRRRDTAVPVFAAAALFGLTGLFHVIQQVRHRYPPDFLWPLQFERVHVIGVAAICCLWAEVVRAALRSRP